MTFKFSFKVDPEGMTVPYAPVTDEIRRNRGFIDLRNDPERAGKIEEAVESPALRDLLVRVANRDSPIFTIGCDLGVHQERTHVPVRRREVAGGYIQFSGTHYDKVEPQSYAAFANAIARAVESRAGEDHWKLDCIGKWVDFKFQGEPEGIRPSLWIWFFAASNTSLNAVQSRERLIQAIDAASASHESLKIFGGTFE